jgi:anti-sigma28 factor (negative regulator of flagellin synthesis)
LISLLEVSATVVAVPQPKSGGAISGYPSDFDRTTLSDVVDGGIPATVECVRWGKVAAIRAALAAGTYSVPAAVVAGKLVESMLSGGHSAAARVDMSTYSKRR